MTPTQINTAIAESMGWTNTHMEDSEPYGFEPNVIPDNVKNPELALNATWVPSYTTDLNACAEFEATLTEEQRADYVCQLAGFRCYVHLEQEDMITIAFATPPQRCEAYLRTLNLWIES